MTDAAVPLTSEALASLVAELGRVGAGVVDNATRVDLLTALETLKAAASGAQARVTADFTVTAQADAAQAWAHRGDGDAAAWFAAKEAALAGSLDGQLDSVPGYVEPEGRQSRSSTDKGKRKGNRPSSRIGVYAQVALARHDSPARGSKFTRMALVLSTSMPTVQCYLERGVLSEWRALIITNAVAVLSPELQQVVDAQLEAFGPAVVGRWGDREVDKQVRAMVAALDAEAVIKRMALAHADRRVSVRPAPDGMAYFTGLLPAPDAISVQQELANAASAAIADGDERGRGQLMADTLVARVTGTQPHEGAHVEIQLVMTGDTLVGAGDKTGHASGAVGSGGRAAADDERSGHAGEANLSSDTTDLIAAALAAWSQPADLVGYGPVPGAYARQLVAEAATVTIRRIHVDPVTGEPTGIEARRRRLPRRLRRGRHDSGHGLACWLAGLALPELAELTSSSRLYEGPLRRITLLRDGNICRTPWCSAPARHVDHITPNAAGGPTAYVNGQGLCVRCNLVKELLGWNARVVQSRLKDAQPNAHLDVPPEPHREAQPDAHLDERLDSRHVVATTAPTGHVYLSTTMPLLPRLTTTAATITTRTAETTDTRTDTRTEATPEATTAETTEAPEQDTCGQEIDNAPVYFPVLKRSPIERLLEQQIGLAA